VDVNPVARDEEIRQRLQSVLEATDWFTAPEVRVEEGVVFLKGRVASDELKKWAGDLARNTQDVVAVANRMEVAEPSIWDWGPAWHGLMGLWRDFLRSLPLLFLGLLILGLSVGAGLLAARKTRSASSSPDSSATAAQCDRGWHRRAGVSCGHLHRAPSLGPDPTGVDRGGGHRVWSVWPWASLSGTSPRISWPAFF
jgi:hypothetical protein